MRTTRNVPVAAIAAALALTLSAAARAATITVNTVSDRSTSADRLCSLREAIHNTNAESDTTSGDCEAGTGVDTINFSVSGSITLGSTLPVIEHTLAIEGKGQRITVDGAGYYQIMGVDFGAALKLNKVTVANGNSSYGGGIYNYGRLTVTNSVFAGNSSNYGGGILNEGSLTVADSAFSGNSSLDGGGILNEGSLRITKSTLYGNSALGGFGGGILNDGTLTIGKSTFARNSSDFGGGIFNAGTLTITNTTFDRNSSPDYGGGIESRGTLVVLNSTFVCNSSSVYGGGIDSSGRLIVLKSTFARNSSSVYGGGIENEGMLTVSNSTFSGNKAQRSGGGIDDFGTLTVTDSTFSGNSGGGIYNNGPPASLKSTILAASIGGDCTGTITDAGYNIADDSTCRFEAIGSHNRTDPKLDLAGLRNNGGPTQTIALQPGSPAIDVVPVGKCTNQGSLPSRVTIDQRGYPRPNHRELACDIGAFEAQ